jgi:hypothetical protein
MKGTANGEKFSMVEVSSSSSESKYDQKNAILQSVVKSDESLKVVSKGVGMESSEKSSATTSYQVSKVEKKSCLVAATKEAKEFAVQTPVENTKAAQEWLDMIVKMGLSSQLAEFSEAVLTYKSAPEKEQKAYKFYQNGNIFTIEATIEDEESHKDAEEKVDYVVKGKSEVKFQIDLTNGAFKTVLWGSSKSSVEIKKDNTSYDDESYNKGDVFEIEVVMSEEGSYTAKELTLKAIDLSGYTRTDKVEL